MITDQERIRGAFRRASDRRALVHRVGFTPGGYEVYVVGSSRDVDAAYTVTVSQDGVWRCDCPAGEAGAVACVHRAIAYSRRANDLAAAAQHARAAGLIGSPKRLPPSAANAWLDQQDDRQRAAMAALAVIEHELAR